MRSKIFVILLICVVFLGAVFFGMALSPRTDVFLQDYSISDDGCRVEMVVGISSSMGYTRGFRVKQGGFNSYLTFYPTFGGFNSKIGAKNTFVLEIDEANCDEIYFYQGNGGYRPVLQKDPLSGQWERPE